MSAEHDDLPTQELKGDPAEKTAALFVSLYVVVLAFFILLTSNAQMDAEKSQQVMDSVNKAFSMKIETDVAPMVQSVGEEVSVTQMFNDLKAQVLSVIELKDKHILQDMRHLEMVIPAKELFNAGETTLRPDRDSMLDRLVKTLIQWRKTYEVNVSVMHGVNSPSRDSLSAESMVEVKRMGNVARFLENQGVPSHFIQVGVLQGKPDLIMLMFAIVPRPASATEEERHEPTAH